MRTQTAAVATLACAISMIAAPALAQTTDFTIGVVASITGAFNAASSDEVEGAKTWANSRGLKGRKIIFETVDDESNAVSAQNAFRKLAGNPKVALIQLYISSSSALAAKSFASEYKVPIITGGGADTLGIPPDPWMFKVAPSNKDFMIVVLEYMKRKGYKKLATFTGTDAFGQLDLSNLKRLTPQYGVEVIASENFSGDDTNFNAQLAKLRLSGADMIYSSAAGRAAILFFRQFQQLGITIPMVWTGAAVSQAFFDAIGGKDNANGMMVVVQRGQYGSKVGGRSGELYDEFAKAFGKTPTYFNTFGYDVGLITEAGVNASDGSRQSIRDLLEKLKDLPAINGPVSYSPEDHTGQDFRSIGIGVLKSGVASPAD